MLWFLNQLVYLNRLQIEGTSISQGLYDQLQELKQLTHVIVINIPCLFISCVIDKNFNINDTLCALRPYNSNITCSNNRSKGLANIREKTPLIERSHRFTKNTADLLAQHFTIIREFKLLLFVQQSEDVSQQHHCCRWAIRALEINMFILNKRSAFQWLQFWKQIFIKKETCDGKTKHVPNSNIYLPVFNGL